MERKQRKYRHLGVSTGESRSGKKYFPDNKIYYPVLKSREYVIEWMRCKGKCTLPEIVPN